MSTVIDMPLEMPPPVRRSLRSPSPPSKKRALEVSEEASSAYATRSKTIRTGEGLFDKEATPLDVMAEIDAAAAEEESEEDGEYAPEAEGEEAVEDEDEALEAETVEEAVEEEADEEADPAEAGVEPDEELLDALGEAEGEEADDEGEAFEAFEAFEEADSEDEPTGDEVAEELKALDEDDDEEEEDEEEEDEEEA